MHSNTVNVTVRRKIGRCVMECCKCERKLGANDSFWQVGNLCLCQECWEAFCASEWWKEVQL